MGTITAKNEFEVLHQKYLALKWKEKYLEIINNFTFQVMHLTTVDEVVWGIAKQVVAKMNFEDCVVYLYDKEQNCLIQRAAHGPKNPHNLDIKNPIKIPLGIGIVGTVAETGAAEIVFDTRQDERYIIDDSHRLSEIAVPIYHEGELLGVIDSEHSKVGFYTDQHLVILNTIAAIAANKLKFIYADQKLKNYQKDLEAEVKIKTEALQIVVEKLQRSNQDLESFAYAASHDLQEPLRTITSYLQLITRKEQNLSSTSKEYFDFAVGAAKRMTNLLQGLLTYSRISRVSKSEILQLNMNDTLLLIKANLASSIQAKNVELNFENLNQIKGNKTQIIQLFQNIISNAIKFVDLKRKPVITISSKINQGWIEFQIKDNGIGIDPSYHEKIFDLFSKLNPIGKYEGSGIGLALCKRIMDYHQGEITIDSTQNVGTTFYLKFPFFE